jgi:hypothetical protein
MRSTAEFDAFGPWVSEVRRDDDVPRLFRDYPLDVAAATMTIKVPRRIDRRDADPSMDLYDALVCLQPERVTILTRTGTGCHAREIPASQLQGVTFVADLLDGRLVLHAEGGPAVVRFNAASSEPVERLVRLLRQTYVVPPPLARPGEMVGPPLPVERELQLLYRRFSRHDPVGPPLAVQPRRVVHPIGASPWGRVLARAWPTALQSVIVALGRAEAHVFHRGRTFVTGYAVTHALAHTSLPLARVSAVDTREDRHYAGVSALDVRVGGVLHEVGLDAATAAAVSRVLRDHLWG